MSFIRLDNCTIARGGRELLSGVSFVINPGDCIWIVGPNGVGKSSLLRLTAGLLEASSGGVSWYKANDAAAPSELISYQSHHDATWPDLTVKEVVSFWARLANKSASVDDVINETNLSVLLDQPCRILSAGQSRRVAMAKLLVEDKPVWLMDEPTAPLDKDNRALVTSLMTAHLSKGGAILVASHSAPEKIGQNDRVLRLGETVAA